MNRINPFNKFIGSFVPNWLLRRKEITHGAKLCYARLCQFAGKNGKCFPKQTTLADELCVSVSTVKSYIKELLINKLIEVNKQGLGKPNVYYFLDSEWMYEVVNSIPFERQDTVPLEVQEAVPHSIKRINRKESYKENHLLFDINIPFEMFWDLYDKKVGNKSRLMRLWNRLTDKERESIMNYIPKYLNATPVKQYRKNPDTFLNNRSWEDEIINTNKNQKNTLALNTTVNHSVYKEVSI